MSGETLLECSRVESENALEHLGDKELIHGGEEVVGLKAGDAVEEPFAVEVLTLDAQGFAEPLLVATALPLAEVAFVEAGMPLFGEPLNDTAVGSAVVEHGVEFVANVLG